MGHEVIGVDVNHHKVNLVNEGKPTIIEKDIDKLISEAHKKHKIRATTDLEEAIQQSEISIIAVGTPSSETGHLNLDYIFKVAQDIGSALSGKKDFHIIAVRSTVLPGTCDNIAQILEETSRKKRDIDFAVVDNPEFLREGSAVHDYYNPPYTLIGGSNNEACNKLAELYKTLPGEMVITETRIAEIMKYLNNTFHALKVSFANEVGNICQKVGVDSHKVMDIFVKDKQLNLSSYYLKPGFAYGGSCLPKDLKALQTLAHDHYVEAPVIESIHKTNEKQITRAIEMILKFRDKKIGFLGLSFKAGTDDLRNSPAVSVIESLLGKGCNISIYDRNINISRLTGTNKEYIDFKIPHLSKLLVKDLESLISDCDVLVINTKEDEFRNVVQNHPDKTIIDFIRINREMASKDNYIGINW